MRERIEAKIRKRGSDGSDGGSTHISEEKKITGGEGVKTPEESKYKYNNNNNNNNQIDDKITPSTVRTISLGYVDPSTVKTVKTHPTEMFISRMDQATSMTALFKVLDDINPAMFTKGEYDQLWASYCRNRDRWPDEAFPATDWTATVNEYLTAGPTVPEPSLTGLSSDPERTVEQVTLSLGWNGSEMVMLPVCRACRRFTPDVINSREGLGHCRAFTSPYRSDQPTIRYPMNSPKTETCFEREEP